MINIIGSLVAWPALALVAVIVLYELGHVFAGLATGHRLLAIEFGVISFRPPFRFSIQRARRSGASAMTLMSPIHARNLRWRAIAMTSGGPLMNIGSALAVIWFDSRLSVFAAWFVFFSLIIGSANLIPFRSRAVLSDGKRILLLLRTDGRGERWLAIMQLVAEQRKGVEPRNLRPDLIALAVAVRDDSPDTVAAHAIAYTAAWDRKADVETAELLETALRYSGFTWPQMREAIFCDAGVFQARKRGRLDLAREWLADLPVRPSQLRLRVEAAILEVEK